MKKVKRELKAKRARDPPKILEPAVSKEKDALIRALQVRWWYILPDWPLPGTDFAQVLQERQLKVVPDRELGSEIREENVKDKVKPIGGFPGLFQNRRGRIYDLRDKDSCPSYHNLAEKQESELEELLLMALKCQLEILRAQPVVDDALAAKLEERIASIVNKPPKPVNEPSEANGKNIEEELDEEFGKLEDEDITVKEEPHDIREAMEEEEWP